MTPDLMSTVTMSTTSPPATLIASDDENSGSFLGLFTLLLFALGAGGTILNTRSLADTLVMCFSARDNPDRTIQDTVSKLMILQTSLDLVVSASGFVVGSWLPFSTGTKYEMDPDYLLLCLRLWFTFLSVATAAATCFVVVTRTIFLLDPGYKLNLKSLTAAISLIFVMIIVTNLVLPMYSDASDNISTIHPFLELAIVILAITLCSEISVAKLRSGEENEDTDSETRSAVITYLITSGAFCLLYSIIAYLLLSAWIDCRELEDDSTFAPRLTTTYILIMSVAVNSTLGPLILFLRRKKSSVGARPIGQD